jgi:hypothetical protein
MSVRANSAGGGQNVPDMGVSVNLPLHHRGVIYLLSNDSPRDRTAEPNYNPCGEFNRPLA